MEMHRYVQVALERWYDIILLVLISIAGTFTYLQWNATAKAKATVAVLEPAVANPLGPQAASVTFPDVIRSTIVGERVATRLGGATTPEEVSKGIDVKLNRSMVQNITVPLYNVTVEHKNKDIVIPLTQAVIDEAQQVFVEFNKMDPTATLAELDKLGSEVRANAAKAREELASFEASNNAFQLPRLIESQIALENSLKMAAMQTENSQALLSDSLSSLRSRLAQARSELERYTALKGQYNGLQLELSLASTAVSQGEERLREIPSNESARDSINIQLASDRDRLARAQQAVQDFERNNRIAAFNAEYASQLGLVAEFQRQEAALAGQSGPATVAARLKAAQDEGARLGGLWPEYERLSRNAGAALGQLDTIERRRLEWRLASINSINSYVKQLDQPTLQSDLLIQVLFYALAVIAGLVAGMFLVYVIAYFDRIPRSTEDVEVLTGLAVLGRIPEYRR